MLKSLAMLLCLMLVSVGVCAMQHSVSNPPKAGVAKADSGHKGQKQPQRQPDDNSTANPASASPQPSTPGAKQASQDGSEDRQIQLWLMYFTGALVVVGALQFGSMIWQANLLRQTRSDIHIQAGWMKTQTEHMGTQARLMEGQLTEIRSGGAIAQQSARAARVTAKAATLSAVAAEKSANAAGASAEALINAERGRLRVQAIRKGPLIYQMQIENIGRMPARATQFSLTVVGDTEVLPEVPPYLSHPEQSLLDKDRWIDPGKVFLFGVANGFPLRESLVRNLNERSRTNTWIYGVIRYFDGIHTDACETRFCFGCYADGRDEEVEVEGPEIYRRES